MILTTTRQITIKGREKKANEIGNDRVVEISIERYEFIWKGHLYFCIEIGDYESAIILTRDVCPADPPPFKLVTAVWYLRFQPQEKDQSLVDPATQMPSMSKLTGAQLVCRGEWEAEATVKLYGTALAKLHAHYSTTKQNFYTKTCQECRKLPLPVFRKEWGAQSTQVALTIGAVDAALKMLHSKPACGKCVSP